ncbi:MBL fold metallo-hydrolase [Clostridium chromiireducens]|uniref:Toxin A n=1 Tax=Clostridium chromiireducens TaxID=225345 RepID=A0A1V4I425_9CLOT|nr:MBL fold metallo-hydrolase [Clostridium chromiireducens]OPJ54620.1 toxin A [Clostridium chromiireducens]
MRNNFKKILIVVPIILFLCMSYMGTIVRAEDKVNQTSTDISNNENQTNTNIANTQNDNKTNTTNNKSTNSTSNNSEQSQSSENVSETENSSAVKKEENPLTENISGWKNINGKLYYATKDGIVKEKGWFKEKDENPNVKNDNEYYLDEDHSAITGWKEIHKSWYYFDEAGVKQTGWKYIKYNWYYLDKDGIMQTGWIKGDGNRYYFNDEGVMSIGKKYIDDKWYFFGATGILQTGFYINQGKLYYSENDGTMSANEWVKTRSSKYYIKADSSAITGNAIIDNVAERFDDNGKYIGPGDVKEHLFIKYLSVGNADCAFIKLPSGETALIDTGTPESSQDVINFLKEQNLKKDDGKGVVDYIIITHAHSDHIGGLASILENFNVKKVYMPEIAKMKDWYSNIEVTEENRANVEMMKIDYNVYNDAVKAMKDKNLEFTNTKKGEFIDKDNVLQFVESDKNFGPIGTPQIVADYWGVNENSAIVFLNYGDLKALFAADMEWNSEKDFWKSDLLQGKQIDVLKVSHHGYDTSSTPDFVRYLKPIMGVISRDKDGSTKGIAYKNLVSNGVTIYETSAKDGVSIYATPENWTVGK